MQLREREDVPDLPRDLCDTWSWIKWDYAGRPQRSSVRDAVALHAWGLHAAATLFFIER